ncbi:hypothetical protein MKEN_00255300 [Mycena kentingensis (nom. inval.)]|nr:hypothetical protein MKEN_00255300 [Mycena kentingensis (nom. inval.)]
MCTIGTFLDGGHKDSPEPFSPCDHAPGSAKFMTFGISFDPSAAFSRQRMAAFRFQIAPTPQVKADTPETKYIKPVIEIFENCVRAGEPRVFSYEHETSADREFFTILVDVEGEKKRLALVNFLAPGIICWDGLMRPTTSCPNAASILVQDDAERLLYDHSTACQFVVFTDGHGILVVNHVAIQLGRSVNAANFTCNLATNGRNSLRQVLAVILYQAPFLLFDPVPYPMFVQGCMNQAIELEWPTGKSPLPAAKHFRDFDFFALQRSVADLKGFLAWREDESRRVFASPVDIGSVFQVQRHALAEEQGVWCCPFPNPALPPSSRHLVTRNPRSRLPSVDAILASSPETVLSFRVTKVVRHRQNTFSQVFFGVLCAADGTVSKPVCLKLFVDTLFPINKNRLFEDFDSDSEPCWRLQTLNYGEDLARREESAYQRLAEYQGTLLSHCYGFHRFTLDDRYNAYGALLEIIPGPRLADLELDMWSKPVQQGLVRQLRECMRALLYAGVDQGDWHGGQVLFPSGADYNPKTDSVVLIDFAFAMQRLGDEQRHGVAANLQSNGHIELKIYLRKAGIPEDVQGACFGWDDMDTNEW